MRWEFGRICGLSCPGTRCEVGQEHKKESTTQGEKGTQCTKEMHAGLGGSIAQTGHSAGHGKGKARMLEDISVQRGDMA